MSAVNVKIIEAKVNFEVDFGKIGSCFDSSSSSRHSISDQDNGFWSMDRGDNDFKQFKDFFLEDRGVRDHFEGNVFKIFSFKILNKLLARLETIVGRGGGFYDWL